MNVCEMTVVVLDADAAAAQRAASQINFLGFSSLIAADESSLLDAMAQAKHVSAIVAGANPGYTQLALALEVIEKHSTDTGCVLLNEGADTEVPTALATRVQSVLSPFASYKELLESLETAVEAYHHGADRARNATSLLNRHLVGSSDDMQVIHRLIEQVSDSEASVLITGESGTGKEVVARCIHSLSARSNGPFVPVNCGAIPAELLESELFGHEKGAFTGAISARQGRFEIAKGGTLFLDEIGDMPLDMQVKLLRVLQERTFERVGSNKIVRADVRIVAATHRNLEQLVAEGKFRMDLFYRLNVFPIEISPLRKRACDIPGLVQGYVAKLERERHSHLSLSDSALACLSRYYWPGNVRELYNLLERLAILFPSQVVQWSDLPEKYRPNHELFVEQLEDADAAANTEQGHSLPALSTVNLPSEGIDLRPHLADIERSLMTQALRQSEWVVARAAKLLNLQRTTLVEKMRKFEIQRPEELPEF